MAAMTPKRMIELRQLIRRAKRWDMLFGVLGVLALMVGILTLLVLFVGMVIDGVPRLNVEFFK